MARVRKSTLNFNAINLEGSLLSPSKFAEVAERKATEQTDADYGIPKGLNLRDEAARYFRIGQALFRELHASPKPSLPATVRFTTELLRDVFGFSDIVAVTDFHTLGDRTFPLTLEALRGRVPIVVVPPADTLDHTSPSLSHDRRRSAASALQDWLNADDKSLWGLCTNGECLRLLRDNESLTRPAYLEANLRQIFEGDDIASFSALRLALYSSRFGKPGTPPSDCPLERWREAGGKEGLTARYRLSQNVELALKTLGNGFLNHPENAELAGRLRDGTWPLDRYFSQLLRLVYRLIFLLAAEDRNLLHPPETPAAVRKLYAQGYSLGALRDRAIRRSGWDTFHDRWEGLRITFRALAEGQPRLGLPALGGLFSPAHTPELDAARLSNRALMEAIFRLAWLRDDGMLMPVNWRDMETEELGSVYESLLELVPRLTADGRGFAFAEGIQQKGNARKTTGSYYTPDSLVQALLDSALDPVLNRVESEAPDPVAGLLGVTVIDPACGSGHFLLAAARRIATRVARLRSGGVPTPNDYRHALRDVVRSTIHGVDRNPMAVELTKVALWIETVEPGKPLGFLDANIRLGDSLLGIFDLKALEKGIPDGAYKPLTGDHKPTAKDFEKRNKSEKGERTRVLDFAGNGSRVLDLPPLAQSLRAVRQLPEDTVEEVRAKSDQFYSASHDPRLHNLAQAADLYIAAFLTPKTETESLDLRTALIPTTEDVWTAMRGGTVYGPRLGAARQLVSEARAFHWPLEFPDILNSGGFDIVLGNPPWERIKLQEQEFFASREPAIAEAPNAAARGRLIQQLKAAPERTREWELSAEFERAKRAAEAGSEFARLKEDVNGRFPLSGRGDVNTYALFAELFMRLAGPRGRAGVIVPTGIATDITTSPFFGYLVSAMRLVSLHDFQTGLGFFDDIGHARFKFCLLTICYENLGPRAADFSFFSRTIDEFRDRRRHFALTPDQIEQINPNTKTASIFRSSVDADLTANIYKRIPVLIDETTKGLANPWNLCFMAMFHMANDSNLFGTPSELAEERYKRQVFEWEKFADSQVRFGPEVKPEKYLPLYEAKMIHIYDHRWATYEGGDSRQLELPEKRAIDFEIAPQYVMPTSLVREQFKNKDWTRGWLIGWRDICRSTDERTVVIAAFPFTATNNKLPILVTNLPSRLLSCLYGNLASLILDFTARQKIGSTSLTYFYLKQLPVLPPSFYSESSLDFITPRVLELTYTSHSMAPFARDLGYDGPPFPWDEDRRALLRAELDAWYARAYGLTRDELRYILDPSDVMGPDYPSETFRVLKNNEIRKYGEYRTQRLVLDAWDRMERGELQKPEPYQRSATEPIEASRDVNPATALRESRRTANAANAQQPGLQFVKASKE